MVLMPFAEHIAAATTPYCYRQFGYSLVSNQPFEFLPPAEVAKPDVLFLLVDRKIEAGELMGLPVYTSISKTKNGLPVYYLYRSADAQVLSYTDQADFWITQDRIICFAANTRTWSWDIEMILFTRVIPFWLETRGYPTLHASAISLDGRAVAFLGDSGAGKSTLAAELLNHRADLITDDILAIKKSHIGYCALPSYAALKLWPESAQHFWGSRDDFQTVHPRSSKKLIPLDQQRSATKIQAPVPLARLYILKRQAPNLPDSVDLLSVQEALMALVRYSFTPYIMKVAGVNSSRFRYLAGLAQQVPLCRLNYSNSLGNLKNVSEIIIQNRQK